GRIRSTPHPGTLRCDRRGRDRPLGYRPPHPQDRIQRGITPCSFNKLFKKREADRLLFFCLPESRSADVQQLFTIGRRLFTVVQQRAIRISSTRSLAITDVSDRFRRAASPAFPW